MVRRLRVTVRLRLYLLTDAPFHVTVCNMNSEATPPTDREGDGGSRPYRMTARAKATERTRERILEATYQLWLEHPYDEVSMDAVADRAAVSRQTVHRHFGTKDDLVTAVTAWRAPREDAERSVPVGDVAAAVRRIVERNEEMGDANIRALEVEDRIAVVQHMLGQGRRAHRTWVETVFAPHLPDQADARERIVDALYVALDVTVWKLLRRDFAYSVERTEQVMRTMVDGVLAEARKEGA